jgi:hypothetical protein
MAPAFDNKPSALDERIEIEKNDAPARRIRSDLN